MKKPPMLYRFIAALLAPAAAALLLAGVVYTQFEKSMEANANYYVENLVDSIATRIGAKIWDAAPKGVYSRFQEGDVPAATITSALSDITQPGIFLVRRGDGTVLYRSFTDKRLLNLLEKKFRSPVPAKIRVGLLNYYTGMCYRIPYEDLFVVGAVSWEKHFGFMVLLVTVWPFIMGALAVATVLIIYTLYDKLILPLRAFDREMSSLRLGYGLTREPADYSVPEMRHLRLALELLAQSEIEKENLSLDYVSDIVKVQEEERERISREIHDGPLQSVTALVQHLRLLSIDLADEEAAKKIASAERIAMAGVGELREFCNNLTPPWLDLALPQSLDELCNRMSAQYGVEIDLDAGNCGGDLPPPLCLSFYRVAQEAISNSVNHGKATAISLRLEAGEGVLAMRIEDNGTGFEMPGDIKELRVKGHRGISNMKERMRLVGGTLEIKSSFGIGTIISCEVPLQNVK